MAKSALLSLRPIKGPFNHSAMSLLVERINAAQWIGNSDLSDVKGLNEWFGATVSNETPGIPNDEERTETILETIQSLVECLNDVINNKYGRTTLRFVPENDTIIILQWKKENETDKA